jgi:RTX calcium-binding nonapeptide repeat (4 copies)
MNCFHRPSNCARSVRPGHHLPLSLEELERREVPAGLVQVASFGGTLTITGLDDLRPALNNQQILVTGAGTQGVDVSVLNGTKFRGTALTKLHFTRVNAVTFDMGLGNDVVIVSGAAGISRVTAFGGAGDDVIQLAAGVTATSELYGGPGNDVLVGGSGPDILDGGDGNDQLFGGAGRDLLVGGFGVDVLNGGAGDDIITGDVFMLAQDHALRSAALNKALADWNSAGSFSAQIGAAFADVFLQTTTDNTPDLLAGGADRDWFFGRLGGPGSDLFFDHTADELINLNFSLFV